MSAVHDVIVIGASQSGLSASYRLTERAIEHLVLEGKDRVGHAWGAERWDSFTLVTPNWFLNLPGHPYEGTDPDAFMPRDKIVEYLASYQRRIAPPIRFSTTVRRMTMEDGLYRLEADDGEVFRARNVIVATGFFHHERVPACAKNLPEGIRQLGPKTYRSPEQAPSGAVLVVGSSMSGVQISEDFLEQGRKVYIAVGSGNRIPRRYRGRDVFSWMIDMGWLHKPVDQQTEEERYRASLQLSGARGGRDINLHDFVEKGATLVGQLTEVCGCRLSFNGDVNDKLKAADSFNAEFRKTVDAHITALGLDAPAPDPDGPSGIRYPVIRDLDLEHAGIETVIWTTGYRCDFRWIDLPVFDGRDFPRQQRGVTALPGLYFCGQHWLYNFASGGFNGVGDDAAHIAEHILARS